MVRAIRNSTVAAILIGGALGAGLMLPAAFSQSNVTACDREELSDGENVSSAEVGASRADEIQTTADSPTAIGLGGPDCLTGRDNRADTLLGGDGRDELQGESGRDYLDGGNNSNRMEGGAGGDIIKSGGTEDDGVFDEIFGGDGPDQIYLSGGRARVDAGAGDDVVVAANGHDDVIDCGDGSDQVLYEPADQIVNCEEQLALSSRIRKPGLKITR